MNSGGMSTVMRSYGSWVSPSTLAQDHLRARHLQLEALAPHLLDQHRQLQLAAAAHLERVGATRSGETSIETLPSTSRSSRCLDLAAR